MFHCNLTGGFMESKQMNRRQLLKTLGVGASMVALAACAPAAAPGAAPASGQSAAPAAEATTVTLCSSFTRKNAETETALVEKFNASQGDVVIDYQFQGTYEETAQKVTAALQARTAPDVSLLSDVWWFKFYLDRMLMPLDDLLKAQKVQTTDYVDALLKEGVRQGKTYWLPFARSTPLFYYNKDAWAKAGLPDRGPRTWDELTKEWYPKLKGQTQSGAVFAHPSAAS